MRVAFDFTAGALPSGARIQRAAGPYSYRDASGALVKGGAADLARFDYDPPVENQVAYSDTTGWLVVGSINSTSVIAGERTINAGAIAAGGQAYIALAAGPAALRTFSFDIKGAVGGEEVYCLWDDNTVVVATQKVILTTSYQRVTLTGPASAVNVAIGNFRSAGTGDNKAHPAQSYSVRRAQINRGPLAFPFAPTTGSAIYTPAVCRGLVLEPARTNLLFPSEAIEQFNETSGAAVTANVSTAPDGTLTADRITPTGGTVCYASQNIAKPNGSPFSVSFFGRRGGNTWMHVSTGAYAPANRIAWFNLDDGTIGTVQPSVTAAISVVGIFYRCSASSVSDGSSYNLVGLSNGDNSVVGAASPLDAWGGQLEAGAQASSYIPTTTGPATRPAETLILPVPTPDGPVDVKLTYADGSSEIRPGTIAGQLLTLAATTPRVIARASMIVVGPARFAAADYAGAMRALMPRGAAWSLDPASVQGQVLGAFGKALERLDASAVQLLLDAFPATSTALLPEWEATLGLPDTALGAAATDEQRCAQVVARLIGAGGQSRQRFIDFAAALGFTITIFNYAPLRAGYFRAGDQVFSEAWADAWGIRITANAGPYTPAALKAELDLIRPAETTTLLV